MITFLIIVKRQGHRWLSHIYLKFNLKTFSKQLSMHIAASNPLALESGSIEQSIIDKEQELVTEELKNSGKPDEIAKKISIGKLNKFKAQLKNWAFFFMLFKCHK